MTVLELINWLEVNLNDTDVVYIAYDDLIKSLVLENLQLLELYDSGTSSGYLEDTQTRFNKSIGKQFLIEPNP